MSLSFFCDKKMLPSESEVAEVLENTATMWKEIKQYIEKYGLIKEEWKFYSQKAGWCKKILIMSNKEEKNIVFISEYELYYMCFSVW